MDVVDALRARTSVRAFLPTEVAEQTVREILSEARHAPSGGNLQPWKVHVVMGAARTRLIDVVAQSLAARPQDDESELHVYPDKLWEPYRTRRFTLGEAMYEKLGIPRADKLARLGHFARNYRLFDAPVGLFFSLDRRFDHPQWAHLGMFMQSIALVAVARDLGTCMQEAWQARAKTVSAFLGLAPEQQLYCGMALGHPDLRAPVNTVRSERAPIDDFTTFLDA
ncbi:MAG: nitroreductase [Polyangiales bacterium]